MVDHGLAVGGKLDVHLDAEVSGDGRPDRLRHVLHDAASVVMQAAVGDRTCCQPIGRAHQNQATSNRPSISTAASAGREATPTVLREWRPLSPNAATIRSDAPFNTLGPSTKSG